MSKPHFVRLIEIDDNGIAKVQGPPPPRWLLDLLKPFAPGEIVSVLIMASRVEIIERKDGVEREIVITGEQWARIGGPTVMRQQGLDPPTRDDFTLP